MRLSRILSFFGVGHSKAKKLIAPVSNEELQAISSWLATKYADDETLKYNISGLLQAIKANDSLMLTYIFDELNQRKVTLDHETKEALVFIAASRGRVKILETLCRYIDYAIIMANPLAERLLNHPYRYLIDGLCEQHIDGSGKLVATNLLTDMSLLVAFLQDQLSSVSGNKLSPVMLLNEMDMQGFANYVESLKAKQIKSSTFIVVGAHFFFGNIQYDYNENRFSLICFDLHDHLSGKKHIYASYYQVLLKVFPGAELFIAKSPVSYSSAQYDIFALLKSLQLLQENTDSLMHHAKNNISHELNLVIGKETFYCHVFNPPMVLVEKDEHIANDFTLVTRSGFMGVTGTNKVGEFYRPLNRHHVVDAYVDTHSKLLGMPAGGAKHQYPGLLVAWLVNKSPDEMADLVKQHTIN